MTCLGRCVGLQRSRQLDSAWQALIVLIVLFIGPFREVALVPDFAARQTACTDDAASRTGSAQVPVESVLLPLRISASFEATESGAVNYRYEGSDCLRASHDAVATNTPVDDLAAGAAKVPRSWGAGAPNKKGVRMRWTDPNNAGAGFERSSKPIWGLPAGDVGITSLGGPRPSKRRSLLRSSRRPEKHDHGRELDENGKLTRASSSATTLGG
jgi:hypothetical protein